ncbi:MAG: thioredoxin family protein [Azospirillaceae bacterium]
MPALQTPVCDFGWKAVDFSLPGTDGQTRSLADIRGETGTLIMFICNHCPYVRTVIDRLVEDCRTLQGEGIGCVAIMPNDTTISPGDGFEAMRRFAEEHAFPFPYLIDETQDVARAYGAVCTPDFFGFDKDLGLQYRGRLDASKTTLVPDARRELLEAMRGVARTGQGPADQIPSMGCSIKWRDAA